MSAREPQVPPTQDATGPPPTAEAAALALSLALQRRDEALHALLAALHREQALELAAALRAGAPCPVCGSGEHPAPARAGADLEAARAELAGADERVQAARVRLRRARAREPPAPDRTAPGGRREGSGAASPRPAEGLRTAALPRPAGACATAIPPAPRSDYS